MLGAQLTTTGVKVAVAAVGGVLLLGLAACGDDATAAPAQSATTPAEDTATAAADTAEAGAAERSEAPAVYRDTLATYEEDRGAGMLLAKLDVADSAQVALDLTLHREGAGDIDFANDALNITLPYDASASPSGAAGYFTIVLPGDFVDVESAGSWLPVRGTFAVDAQQNDTAAAVFVLTPQGEVDAVTSTDAERCLSIDTIEAEVGDAARALNDGTDYVTLQDAWADAPRVWGAVKQTANTLASSGGQNLGDWLSTACGDVWGSGS